MSLSQVEKRTFSQPLQNDLPILGFEGSAFSASDCSSPALTALLSALSRHFWKILAFSVATVLVVFGLSKIVPPVYEATSTLEINPERPSELLGPGAVRTAWSDVDQYIATQLRVIQEDSVLRPVVKAFQLAPNPENDPTAPILLKDLQVVRPPNTYLIQISYRSRDRAFAAAVANAISEAYLHHVFQNRIDDRRSQTSFMENQLDGLRLAMERSTQAVNEFERKLGVVDPQEKTNIISARLMQLNTEYTTAQTDRIKREAEYAGLKSGSLSAAQQSEQSESLKRLQNQLNEAQQRFTEVREHYGAKHPEYEKQQAIIAGLVTQVEEAKQDVAMRAQVAYQNSLHREQLLKGEVAEAKANFDDLNAKSYRYQALKIEAENNRKLYDDVEQRIKEAGINGTFQSGMTHVSDVARPPLQPIYPRVKLNLWLALAFSLIAGVLAALFLELSNDKIRGADEVQAYFHIDVLGVIPEIVSKPRLLAPVAQTVASLPAEPQIVNTAQKPREIPATSIHPPEGRAAGIRVRRYEESLKMLWSSFQLFSTDNAVHSMMVTSAMPEEGKTTVTLQIAAIHAMHNHKTLVIDADLRRPGVHRMTSVIVSPGLADVVESHVTWRECVVESDSNPNLYILPAGQASARSFDEIVRLLPRLIAEAESEFDLILIDAPPLLSFSESLHIASTVDGVMIVVCADQTSRHSLSTVLSTLKRLRTNIIGVAINRVAEDQQPGAYKYLQYYEGIEAA